MKSICNFRLLPAFVSCVLTGLVSIASAQIPSSEPLKGTDPATPGIIVPLWPDGKMPGHGAALPETRNLPVHSGVVRVNNVSQAAMEIFKAPATKGAAPAMIISPGGGYGILAWNFEGTQVANWLNSIGITGIVLKYRVPNNREGAYQDIERAMRLTREHAKEWGIDPDKLGVMGFSAGGHLSARLGSNYDKAAYAPVDEADQLSCRPDFVILVYPGYLGDTGKLAPEVAPSASTPPTLLVHTEDDLHHIAGSRIYEAALTAAKVPHLFLLYPTGGHGFSMHTDKAARVWPLDIRKWLQSIGVLTPGS